MELPALAVPESVTREPDGTTRELVIAAVFDTPLSTTVTVTLFEVVPPGPVQVTVYVVVWYG